MQDPAVWIQCWSMRLTAMPFHVNDMPLSTFCVCATRVRQQLQEAAWVRWPENPVLEALTRLGRRISHNNYHVHACAHAAIQVRQQVQEAAWVRRSENTVLEALTRLANLHEALRAALCNQAAAGRGRHGRSMDVPRWQI